MLKLHIIFNLRREKKKKLNWVQMFGLWSWQTLKNPPQKNFVICWWLSRQHMTTFKCVVRWRQRYQHMTSLDFHILIFKYFETKTCNLLMDQPSNYPFFFKKRYMVEKYRVYICLHYNKALGALIIEGRHNNDIW